MANKFLIRSYNVGLGDCFYLRIPDGPKTIHVLIDCGTKGKASVLKTAIDDIKTLLPVGSMPGKKRLDLIVATHRHEDHIKGFDPAWFADVEIGHIWMTAMMDPNHEQAKKSQALDRKAIELVAQLSPAAIALSPDLQMLVSLFGIDNVGAEKALREELPAANRIDPKYVVAGDTAASLGLGLQETKITVLGPEKDIDHFYLGKDIDQRLRGLTLFEQERRQSGKPIAKSSVPFNIGAGDFAKLQARMLSDAFAFAKESGEVINNSSVVLLIEWRNKRLLFVGDAEWHNHFEAGDKNGAWNVIWNQRKEHLNKRIDFLKIGHHGSINSTPWLQDGAVSEEVNQILDAILPKPTGNSKPKAKALVSTERTIYPTIPHLPLLEELSKRVGNTKNYKNAFDRIGFDTTVIQNFDLETSHFDRLQPVRTDFECLLSGGIFAEIAI
ncbi:metallohydrolase [Haliscomenobacter sp.]|uniref:metallohydrolase n=1 Tax=Haliscomenobacter sp. TaxID=2717303 RepID=UPI00336524DC